MNDDETRDMIEENRAAIRTMRADTKARVAEDKARREAAADLEVVELKDLARDGGDGK